MTKIKTTATALCILIASCISLSTNAQKSDVGNWFIYLGNQKINDKWNWHNEVQYRNFDFAGDLEQLLLRTGIGYNLTERNNNVLLGYSFINSEPYISGTRDKKNINEQRVYQQFLTKQTFNRVNVTHRYRVEERFIEDDFKLRFRYFISLNIPINKREMTKNAIYFSAYNELFINSRSAVFDRNRIYSALGFCISKDLKVEAGAMSQIFENKNRTQFQIAFFNSLPFQKQENK